MQICLKYPHICIQMGVVEEGGVLQGAHTELSTRQKKQPIVNDMGQLHYTLTESVISILCHICYWTSLGPLCENIEELYNRISVVWCISALLHAHVLFCIHIACRMWQFSFWGWGLWRAELGPNTAMQEHAVPLRRKQVAATDSFHPKRTWVRVCGFGRA